MSPRRHPSLEDIQAKVGWAWHHFDALQDEIIAFEEANPKSYSAHINADTGEYVFHVHGLNPVKDSWGLRIGDVLHNARTALDYLMVRLVAFVTGQEPRDIGMLTFPIYSDPDKFTGAVSQVVKEPLFSGYLARIKELQPFNNGNPSIWGSRWGGDPVVSPLPQALDRLARLDNLDKHRVIHATWLGVAWQPPSAPKGPSDFKLVNHTLNTDPLKDDAEIARWRFATPLPREWIPTQVEMKDYFPVEVAFDEPVPLKGVQELLPFCLWAVEMVIRLFEPVFQGAPPLPVTSVEDPPF
jgi:hypothetical protein